MSHDTTQPDEEPERPLVQVDELAHDIAVQLACCTHLLPLRGKRGTPPEEMDRVRMRLAWELASRLLRGHEIRRRVPLRMWDTGMFMPVPPAAEET